MSKSRYLKQPEPPEETKAIYDAVLRVLAGHQTVTDAAASVGLSRVRFQTLMHRGLSGLSQALGPQPRGRKAKPESERALEQEVAALRRQKEKLEQRAEANVRMMKLAAEWMHKGLRGARQTGAAKEAGSSDGDDDEAGALLEGLALMTANSVPPPLAAVATGVSVATARRWLDNQARARPPRRKRGPRPSGFPSAQAEEKAREVVREARGCIGAAPLAVASGLSRRCASRVKAEVRACLEGERRAAAVRVHVVPGVIRGFDAMLPRGGRPESSLLIAGDAGLPLRTSLEPVPEYTDDEVARFLDEDFTRSGAPLVLRMDRAKQHQTPKVHQVLRAHRVLVLHGPPHHPRFYGQLERQNREHRAWFDAFDWRGDLRAECQQARRLFNELVPRRTLGWKTPAQAWQQRPQLNVDRRELAAEVEELTTKLEEDEAVRGGHPGMAERLAIEAALTKRGLLKQTKGGWC